jgi:N2-acetyl-L-2,4-diaminobutanoate deacetylase
MSNKSKIQPSIDLNADGKQFGYLDTPHSRNESAWGALRIPIATVKNGDGPTLLITGGNHGDEYEGPIAAMNLMRKLDPANIQGRVIAIPFLNYPAVRSGNRVSPIDGVNMNRAFPGDADGTISYQIAHFVNDIIVPECDVVMDIHSGGKTLMFEAFAAIHHLDDPAHFQRCKDAMLAFGAPISLVLVELDSRGMLDTSVEDAGKIFLSTELGGGGTALPDNVRIAEDGLLRLLVHLGIMAASDQIPPCPETRFMDTAGDGCFNQSNDDGMFEMLVNLGEMVSAGQPLAQVHDMQHPEREPQIYTAGRDGLLIGRHHPGLIGQGDFLSLIAYDVD